MTRLRSGAIAHESAGLGNDKRPYKVTFKRYA